MDSSARAALDLFVVGLRRRRPTGIRRVLLFGSQARGEARRGSDIDVLVIAERRTAEVLDAVYDAALDVLVEAHRDLSVKVCDDRHVEAMERISDPFLTAIRREGVDLWTPSAPPR